MLRRILPMLLLTLVVLGCSRPRDRVVLFCAQDKEFADLVLGDFTGRTGLRVLPHFDTEAGKSVPLYEELVRDAGRPRCDVFWNNEILLTLRLQKRGVLQPYPSPSAEPYPEWAQGPDQTWHAFAARARVLVVNTERVSDKERPQSLFDLTGPRWKGKVAMAKPQFGTTATQAACLFEVLGAARAQQFYRDLRANEVHILPGNKQVAEAVAKGQFDVGLTDTDDAIVEVEQSRPVALVFPDGHRARGDRMGTLFIPNTVMLIRNSPSPEGGKKLIDYLLSAEVERRLAEGPSRQIPLNPGVKPAWPEPVARQMRTPQTAKPMEVDFARAADLWEEVQEFLRNEFARP